MEEDKVKGWDEVLSGLEPPILLLSTHVGRGMYTLGQALMQRLPEGTEAAHHPIEDFLPQKAVAEDVKRYKKISNDYRFLLYLIYKVPFFYWRKLFRERHLSRTDLSPLQAKIEGMGAKTVLCVSHRATFWASDLKDLKGMDYRIHCLLGEYGSNLGYRYLFWGSIDGFLSPVGRRETGLTLPAHASFTKIELPARLEYERLADTPGDPKKTLLVCGFWGQGPIGEIIEKIRGELPDQKIIAVCGENCEMKDRLQKEWGGKDGIRVEGQVDSLAPLMSECASIITKPGISTILESHAAGRKAFLLPGMPVAEDNNARYAVGNFGAEWFSPKALARWRQGR